MATELCAILRAIATTQDENAWRELVHDLGPEMLRIAQLITKDPQLADDAVQEALLYVRDNADACHASSEPGVRAWLLRVSYTATLQILRRQKSRQQRDIKGCDFHTPMVEKTPLENISDAEVHEQLRSAVLKLPKNQRESILLYYLNDLSYNSIAEALSCTPENARVRVHRGLQTLRKNLGRIGIACTLISLQKYLPAALQTPLPTTDQLLILWEPLLQASSTSSAAMGMQVSAIVMPVAFSFAVLAGVFMITSTMFAEYGREISPYTTESTMQKELVYEITYPHSDIDSLKIVKPSFLDKQMTVHFEKASLLEVFTFLRRNTDANILFVEKDDSFLGNHSITTQLTGLSFREVMDTITQKSGLDYIAIDSDEKIIEIFKMGNEEAKQLAIMRKRELEESIYLRQDLVNERLLQKVTIDIDDISIKESLYFLETLGQLKFVYDDDLKLENLKHSVSVQNMRIRELLQYITEKNALQYELMSDAESENHIRIFRSGGDILEGNG